MEKEKKPKLKYKGKDSKFKLYIPVELVEDHTISPYAKCIILYLYSKRSIKHFKFRKSIILKLLGSHGNYKKTMLELQKLGYIYKEKPKSTGFVYRKINEDFTPIIEKLEPHPSQLLPKSDSKLGGHPSQELGGHPSYIDIKSPLKGDFNKIEKNNLKEPINTKKSLSESPLSTGPLGAVSGLQTENQNQDREQGLDNLISVTNPVARLKVVNFDPRTPLKTNLKPLQGTISFIEGDSSSKDKIKPVNPIHPEIQKFINSLKNKEVL